MSKDSLKKAISAANSGERFPVMSLIREDPGMAAVISKLHSAVETPMYDDRGMRQPMAPNFNMFKQTSENTAQNINDAQTVMQILPDMELSAQILISSILSPKDMMTTELNYTVTEGLLAPDIGAAMIARVKQHFEQVYKIKNLLPKMLRDILFETGSYPVAVIPENSIDEVINSQHRITMESLSDTLNSDGSIKPIGLLGPVVKKNPTHERSTAGFALEALNSFTPDTTVDGTITLETSMPTPLKDTFLSVTDNHNLLKIPQINQKIREQRVTSAIGSKAMEAVVGLSNMSDRDITSKLYKNQSFGYKAISVLKTQEQLNRRTVGNPLILHLPSESVIPVYVPGCVEEQVGFFVLIDADGNPVSKADNADYYQQLSSRLNSNGSFPSAMLNKVKGMMNGFDSNNREHLDFSARAYGNMVEQDLLARLRNGVYGNGVALAKKEEIYRIMLSRALAKQHTQLLFLPIELMTYFAFRFTDNGIGKSLLEDMKILNSLRSMLLFANVMSSLKNSIGRTEVKLKLDESDPDPKKTIELAMHEIVRSRQQYFPLGMNSPTDLVDWLQRSGFEFTFEGHPGLPDVAIDFGEKNSNYIKPDTELEDNLRKRAIMSTGLSPETVDATFQAEFATSIVTNNILLSKRVMQIQEQFTPLLSSHLRKAMMNSEDLMHDLTEILENNFDKLRLEEMGFQMGEVADKEQAKKLIVQRFLSEFIMGFDVGLPRPNSVTLENQLTALDTYSKALDATLDAWISDKFFTADTGGQVAGQVETIKEVLKAYFLRQWMSENGVMTELNNLTTKDSEGNPALDIYGIQVDHIEALTKSLTQFMVGINKVKNASDTIINAIGGVENEPSSGGGDDTGGDGGDGSDAGGGDGDLGGDMPDFAPGPDGAEGGDLPPPPDDEEPSGGGDTNDADATDKDAKPAE